MAILRLLKIFIVICRYQLFVFLTGSKLLHKVFFLFSKFFSVSESISSSSRAIRLRLALENLGPVFVKFGQMLSTRPDLIPPDLAEELAKLQDDVPAFSYEIVQEQIEKSFALPISQVFSEFSLQPVAAASIAQVHFAKLINSNDEVAVKILRPGIAEIIDKDLALMDLIAVLLAKFSSDGKRLRPREVVEEFAKHIHAELNLLKEAANCSQLGRNFADRKQLIIPQVYWDYCHENVMVMQRVFGTPISQIERLTEQKIDLEKLSALGVEIFFTQVFRDGFFHADMHPGNIMVAEDGRYIAVDFGIVAQLSEQDKTYLAQNFLAFFRRDYYQVAKIHVESGWAPIDTRIEEFEAAIRFVCEPIFERPLKDISFGKLLLRLFQTSRNFNVHIQPQLVMLQKTLLNIEGLGRQLNPDLDLWKTAKPFLEKWMNEQIGWRSLWKNIQLEAGSWSKQIPQLPRLIHQQLQIQQQQQNQFLQLYKEQQKSNHNLKIVIFLLIAFILSLISIVALSIISIYYILDSV